MENHNIQLSLIIACYNEENHLEKNAQEIIDLLECLQISYEIIMIDDCSKDSTPEIIRKFSRRFSKIKVKFHEKNVGRGGTVKEGFLMASGDIVGYIDIDLEIAAHYILAMYFALNNGYDGATGRRICEFALDLQIVRWILSQGYKAITKLMLASPFADTETGLKFFKREKILPVLKPTQHNGWFWDTEIMIYSFLSGLRIKEIPVVNLRRNDKKSTVRIFRDSLDYLKSIYMFKKKLNKDKRDSDRKN